MPTSLRTDVRGGEGSVFGRRPVRTTVVTLLAALVALFSPALVGAARAASAPTDFAGISDWGWPTATQATQLGSEGVHTVRAGLPWDWVEHTQGIRQWGGVDDLMTKAATNHYELLMVLNGCTAWACGQARTEPTTPAASAAYQDFVRDAVSRYGAGGTFWASHPKLTPTPVSWQVWNEVNVGADWPNPTAAAYASFLVQTSATIKGVDPAARVVASGLAELPADSTGATMVDFLTALEAQPGFRTAADVVALHGYAANPAGTARILDNAKRIMLAAGDSRPIWMTELGWGDGGPVHPFHVDTATMASYLSQAFTTMATCQARWGLQRAMWFSLQDIAPYGTERDYWGMHTGLYDQAGNAKPALASFLQFVNGAQMPGDGTCTLPGGANPAATGSTPLISGGGSNGSGSSVGATSVAPRISITQAPKFIGASTNAPRVDFVTDMGNAGNAQCSLDGGPWTLCATPFMIPKEGEGTYTLSVRPVNAAGVIGAAVSATWSVDLTPPSTVFTKTPKKLIRGIVAARFGVKGQRLAVGQAAVAKYQCSLNGAGWKTCSARYRVKAKKAGRGSLRVRAVDQAGNVDPKGATARFVVKSLRK
ncbi:MAG: hypothetical protein AAGC46_21205 [Solirubrobacteraceae bacterium]|nr:hypothetical protein [Patulibacter sp.]